MLLSSRKIFIHYWTGAVMKCCAKLLLILMPLLLAACGTVGGQTSQTTRSPDAPKAQADIPEPNFALIYRYRACGSDDTEVWDTVKGGFTVIPLGTTTSTTIPLVVKPDELAQFYKQIDAINFFNYPSEFRIP